MTSNTSDARELMNLAERMGIPVDEAVRQLAQVIADSEPPVTAPVSNDAPANADRPVRSVA